MRLSDEYLFNWFGGDTEKFSYAITQYESQAEYDRDRALLRDYNNSAKPQTRFLMVHAAKVERTDFKGMGIMP